MCRDLFNTRQQEQTTASGRVWSWGNNEFGQLGWAPVMPDGSVLPPAELKLTPAAPGGAPLVVRSITAGGYCMLGMRRYVTSMLSFRDLFNDPFVILL